VKSANLSRLAGWVVLLEWFALLVAGIATAYAMRTWDFAVFQIAAKRFLAGAELYRAVDRDMPFKYPPFTAPLFAILGLGWNRAAAVAWNIGSVLSLLWVIRVALPKFRDGADSAAPFAFSPEGTLWAGLILLHPLFFELRRGQADLFVLAAVVATVVLAEKRPWAAGVLAAIAVGLKLPAALLVLYLARFRLWRALVAMAATVMLLEVALLVRYGLADGIALHYGWWRVLMATTPDRVMSTQGWIPLILLLTHAQPKWGIVVVQAAATAVLCAVLLVRRAGRDTWFGALTLAMAGLSPLCWNPNYILAFPALLRIFNRARTAPLSRRRVLVATGLVAALLLTALTPGIVPPDAYQRALSALRPYGWLSLLLLVATIGEWPRSREARSAVSLL
jgi:hypothetical protein